MNESFNFQAMQSWLIRKRNEILDNNPIKLSEELESELTTIDDLLDIVEFLNPIEDHYK